MVSLSARDLALMKLVWWGGAITSHWTGARSAGFSSARLGCLVRCLRARSIPTLCFFLVITDDEESFWQTTSLAGPKAAKRTCALGANQSQRKDALCYSHNSDLGRNYDCGNVTD